MIRLIFGASLRVSKRTEVGFVMSFATGSPVGAQDGEGSPPAEATLGHLPQFSRAAFPTRARLISWWPHTHGNMCVCVCVSSHAYTTAVHNGSVLSCCAWGSTLSDRSGTIWKHSPGWGLLLLLECHLAPAPSVQNRNPTLHKTSEALFVLVDGTQCDIVPSWPKK